MSIKKGGHGGMIVNISSIAGLDPFHRCPVYSASKCGVTAFTRAVSDKEFAAEFGIKFVLICPNATSTRLLVNMLPRMFGTFNADDTSSQIMSAYETQT